MRPLSVGGRVAIVAAATPARPANLGRSNLALAWPGIGIRARLQRRPPSAVENRPPSWQRAIHPDEIEKKRIGARQGSAGGRTCPGGPDTSCVQVRPPSLVRSRTPSGAFGLTGSIQPCRSSTKLRKVGPPPQLCDAGLPSDRQERPPSRCGTGRRSRPRSCTRPPTHGGDRRRQRHRSHRSRQPAALAASHSATGRARRQTARSSSARSLAAQRCDRRPSSRSQAREVASGRPSPSRWWRSRPSALRLRPRSKSRPQPRSPTCQTTRAVPPAQSRKGRSYRHRSSTEACAVRVWWIRWREGQQEVDAQEQLTEGEPRARTTLWVSSRRARPPRPADLPQHLRVHDQVSEARRFYPSSSSASAPSPATIRSMSSTSGRSFDAATHAITAPER
jgi:hypothetical protein